MYIALLKDNFKTQLIPHRFELVTDSYSMCSAAVKITYADCGKKGGRPRMKGVTVHEQLRGKSYGMEIKQYDDIVTGENSGVTVKAIVVSLPNAQFSGPFNE